MVAPTKPIRRGQEIFSAQNGITLGTTPMNRAGNPQKPALPKSLNGKNAICRTACSIFNQMQLYPVLIAHFKTAKLPGIILIA
ncbi:MAG: hypothetical protein GY789_26520 [Hyphomicrobiales bacterium]|nr:hypothetical protein [Hyphomicrobiales bacterium]MCP5000467.1 hypothetical protein [Hyphomicrobiales bacterium]